MRLSSRAAAASLATAANAASLADICTTANVQGALPANETLLGISLLPSTVSATAVYYASLGGGMNAGASTGSSTTYNYCNVTLSFTHTGKGNVVPIKLAFPEPSTFKNRWYTTGGGGVSLTSDATGGYDAFNYSYDEKSATGSIKWDATYAFANVALGELTTTGKPITQVQRWGTEYDSTVVGAPAFRLAQQQVLHVYPATIESAMDCYPEPCALDKFVNATIAACDPLDGRTNGVISRTTFCKLKFNLSSLIGEPYYCAAETSSSLGFGFSKRQMGDAQAVYDGLHSSDGKRAYLSWQIGSDLGDADTTYNNNTCAWELNIPSTGGVYVTRFVQLPDIDKLSDLNNVTYDTLVELDEHWQSVRSIIYPNETEEAALEALSDCPGPYPQDNMATIIDWVENGIKPSRLNATISSGDYSGKVQQLCQWPSRPLWFGNSSSFDCVTNEASIENWTYTFDAFKVPIY
ncbi:tannase-domain-containing protein [Setomelanomma holmii]|uniref:Carboxylic ester hydrolase n=1 Tax=Setomelanomma holmii TaxID=210430 RepID=A0A9P4H1N2_9PLEO|nr:tannase-domain-containing protein [Setomelanomma holmii]